MPTFTHNVRKGHCALCGRAVHGDYTALYAMDTVFHVWCFNCAKCSEYRLWWLKSKAKLLQLATFGYCIHLFHCIANARKLERGILCTLTHCSIRFRNITTDEFYFVKEGSFHKRFTMEC